MLCSSQTPAIFFSYSLVAHSFLSLEDNIILDRIRLLVSVHCDSLIVFVHCFTPLRTCTFSVFLTTSDPQPYTSNCLLIPRFPPPHIVPSTSTL